MSSDVSVGMEGQRSGGGGRSDVCTPTFICCLLWKSPSSGKKNTLHIYTHTHTHTHHTVLIQMSRPLISLTQSTDTMVLLHSVRNGLSEKESFSGSISFIPGEPAPTIKPGEGGREEGEGMLAPQPLHTPVRLSSGDHMCQDCMYKQARSQSCAIMTQA